MKTFTVTAHGCDEGDGARCTASAVVKTEQKSPEIKYDDLPPFVLREDRVFDPFTSLLLGPIWQK
jgi:hypothetical protein